MSTPTTKTSIAHCEEIDKIKANDEHALKTLYVANYPGVEKYVLNNSGSVEDARDVYQEAFIAVWRNIVLDKFTMTHGGSINGYLYQVAKNKWMDVLRKQKGKNVSIEVTNAEMVAEITEALSPEEEHYLAEVKRHFTAMGDPCKELLRQFYFEKKRLKEIAIFFSWTEATAKNNKYRCLQKLRAAILNNQ